MEKKKMYLLIGLGVVALSATGAAYYFSNRAKTSSQDIDLDFLTNTSTAQFTLPEPPKPSSSGSKNGNSSKSSFPLKRGSRGILVKQLQEALIKKYGKRALPKWGADGSWGSELDKALSSNNYPIIITESLFKKIVGDSTRSATSLSSAGAKKIAANLRIAIIDNDFVKALRVVGRIKNKADYKKVSPIFKKKEFNRISYTIVNALLVKFRKPTQKQQLNKNFYRIGLLNDGDKWSLSGIGKSNQLIATIRTRVWNKKGQSVQVNANTLLGELINNVSGVTQFRTLDNKQLFINSKNVSYV